MNDTGGMLPAMGKVLRLLFYFQRNYLSESPELQRNNFLSKQKQYFPLKFQKNLEIMIYFPLKLPSSCYFLKDAWVCLSLFGYRV